MPYIAKKHHEKDILVTQNNGFPFFPSKMQEAYVLQNIKRRGEIFGTEKDPTKNHKMKG